MSEGLPVAVGDELTIRIDNLAFGGDGVGRHDGVPLFVPDVLPGELAKVTVTETRRSFARAALVALEEPSAARVEPGCPLFGRCGGCQLQHCEATAQAAAKTAMVTENLVRLGRLADPPVEPCIPAPQAYGYRNTVTMHAYAGPNTSVKLGFHVRDGSNVLEVEECPLASQEVNDLVELARQWVNQAGWPAYYEPTHAGLVRQLKIRYSRTTAEATCLLVTGRRDVPDKRPWIDALMHTVPAVVGVRHQAWTRASQRRGGQPVSDLVGRGLDVELRGLRLQVSPESFFQVNDDLIEPMLDEVIAAVAPQPNDRLADLYAGVGTFGLSLAGLVGRVSLVEADHAATSDARSNARNNDLRNVECIRGVVERELPRVLAEVKPTKVIVDPPRKGLGEAVIGALVAAAPERIAYVSCDPATLARDLARFTANGYQVIRVQPFDLFPQTYHIEAITTLQRC